MPVSIVVGGQYGSEGKGKVVHHFAKEFKVKAAVKTSGINSGHTFIDEDGKAHISIYIARCSQHHSRRCCV